MTHIPPGTVLTKGGLIQFGGVPSTVPDAPTPPGFVAPPLISQGRRIVVPPFAPFIPSVPTFQPFFVPSSVSPTTVGFLPPPPLIPTLPPVTNMPITPFGPSGPVAPGQFPGGLGSPITPLAAPIGNLGCDQLPISLQAACRATVSIFTQPGPPALPGGVPGGVTTTTVPFTPSGGGAVGVPGLAQPGVVSVQKLQCPRMGNGKIGILWMSKMDGTIVCLPRGVSGAQFGLQRKNKPPTKPMFTGGDINCLKRAGALGKQFKKAAKLFDMTTHKRGHHHTR